MNLNESFNAVTRRALRINYRSPNICQEMSVASASGDSVLVDFPEASVRLAGTVLTVETYTVSRLRLAWPEIPGAFAYVVSRSTSPSGPFEQVIAGLRTFFYIDTPPGPAIWYYQVTGVEPNVGQTLPSNIASGTTTA